MKKLALFLLLLPLLSLAQDSDLPKYENDTLYTTSGFKVTEGQELKIGTGSAPSGDFRFIRRNRNSILNFSAIEPNKGNDVNSMNRNQSGHKYKAFRFERRGQKENGYVYYVILNTGVLKYEIDIENAIASGEIVVPEEFRPKKEGALVIKQEMSLADEILKLKKLYDDGVISKDEFDSAKKKLLEKQ